MVYPNAYVLNSVLIRSPKFHGIFPGFPPPDDQNLGWFWGLTSTTASAAKWQHGRSPAQGSTLRMAHGLQKPEPS